jgi:hypothetical protein
MAEPPVLTGAVQETATEVLPGTPVTAVGAPGTVAGVTAADGVESGPVPVPLVAVTVKVYESPLVNPVTVQVVVAVAQVWPPFAEVVESVAVTV